jgi:hypothetical protein
MGALFLAFALATAASVRTLALVEVLFPQLVARYGLWPTHDGARGNRHGLCRVRRGAFVVGVLNASSAPGKGAP